MRSSIRSLDIGRGQVVPLRVRWRPVYQRLLEGSAFGVGLFGLAMVLRAAASWRFGW